jgi:hypothetical protein
MTEEIKHLFIAGKKIRKSYLEIAALIIGGAIYGYTKNIFINDWNAVICAGLFLIISKLTIEVISKY